MAQQFPLSHNTSSPDELLVTYYYDAPARYSVTLSLSQAEQLAQYLNDGPALQHFFPAIRRALK